MMLPLSALAYGNSAMATILPANSGELHNIFGLTLADRLVV